MAGLTVQNFVSAAVGIAALAAVIRGFAARSGQLARQLLGGPGPDHPLHPAADLPRRGAGPRLPGRRPDARRLPARPHPRRRPTRPSPSARSPRRRRSRSSAPTAAASSTSTAPSRSRTRTASPTSSSLILILVDPGQPHLHLRPHDRQPPPGLGALRGDDGDVHRRGRRRLRRRAARQPRPAPRRRRHPRLRRLDRRQHGGQGVSASGSPQTSLWTAVTTVTSCGAVNGAFDSLTGIGGLVPTANLATGEVIFGGVGSGLYYMLLFVLLTVFIAGLMVGRTPEFLGKKIEAREVKLVLVGVLVTPLLVLFATAWAVAGHDGTLSIYNAGPQGFSESLYAYMSQANNNGSAFAGYTGFLQPNAPGNAGAEAFDFANLLGGLVMLFARFLPMIAALAVAGSLAGKRVAPGRRRHLPRRLADLRRPADRRRRDRRRAHLLPRLPARPGRAGTDRPALLMNGPAQRPDHRGDRDRLLHPAARHRLPAGDHRRRPGAVPRRRRTAAGSRSTAGSSARS